MVVGDPGCGGFHANSPPPADRPLYRVYRHGSGLGCARSGLHPGPGEDRKTFYQYFLATPLAEQQELLTEAAQLSDKQAEAVANEIVAEWEQTAGADLPARAKTVAKELVESLRVAGRGSPNTPGEALRLSLNRSRLTAGHPIPPIALSAEQQSVAQLLRTTQTGRGPRQPAPTGFAVPGYQFLRTLGQGGFASVYLALHKATGELRAVKVGALDDPISFRREIAAVDGLSHPHLVRYFEHGVRDGQFWIAMEYLGNYSLDRVLGSPGGRPNLERSLLLGEQILRGLAALHERGVMHRDVKPANVMVDDSFRLRLIDFGLAKPIHGDGLNTTGVTRRGDLKGTAVYMSPEQVHGDPRLASTSDMWSFGVMFYEMLTGTPPFQGATIMALGAQILNRPIELEKAELPASLRPFLSRCLDRELNRRVPDASVGLKEFAPLSTDLRRQLRHERYRSAWIPVIEKGMLEGFAAELGGTLPEGAVSRFRIYCSTRGVPDLDDERLADVLPDVFAEQLKAEQARQAATKAKETLLKPENARLSVAELSLKLKHIETLEQSEKQAAAQVSVTVRRLLADEAKAWDQILAAEKKAQAVRETEVERQAEAKRLAEVKAAERLAEAKRLAEMRAKRMAKAAAAKRKKLYMDILAAIFTGFIILVVILGLLLPRSK